MSKQCGFTAVEVLAVILIVLGVAGWVMNIAAIVSDCCTPLTGLMVIRIVGIFVAPLGAVMGWV